MIFNIKYILSLLLFICVYSYSVFHTLGCDIIHDDDDKQCEQIFYKEQIKEYLTFQNQVTEIWGNTNVTDYIGNNLCSAQKLPPLSNMSNQIKSTYCKDIYNILDISNQTTVRTLFSLCEEKKCENIIKYIIFGLYCYNSISDGNTHHKKTSINMFFKKFCDDANFLSTFSLVAHQIDDEIGKYLKILSECSVVDQNEMYRMIKIVVGRIMKVVCIMCHEQNDVYSKNISDFVNAIKNDKEVSYRTINNGWKKIIVPKHWSTILDVI